MIKTTRHWGLDYNHIPGCRLNKSSLRFFAVHPDKPWYFVGRPKLVNALVMGGKVIDLLGLPETYPAEDKAATGMAFLSRKT